MSCTVRDPHGNAYHYNLANYVTSNDGYFDVYRKRSEMQKDWIVRVPKGWMIEWDAPCWSTNASTPREMMSALLANDGELLRDAPSYLLANLKRELADFNAHTKGWR